MSRTPEAPGLTEGDMEAPGLRWRLRIQAEAEKGETEICFGSFLTWANTEWAHRNAVWVGRRRQTALFVTSQPQNALFREVPAVECAFP